MSKCVDVEVRGCRSAWMSKCQRSRVRLAPWDHRPREGAGSKDHSAGAFSPPRGPVLAAPQHYFDSLDQPRNRRTKHLNGIDRFGRWFRARTTLSSCPLEPRLGEDRWTPPKPRDGGKHRLLGWRGTEQVDHHAGAVHGRACSLVDQRARCNRGGPRRSARHIRVSR